MRQQIIDEDRRLRNDSGSCFGSGQTAAVSDCEHIVEFFALECLFIYFYPACSVDQGRVFEERVRFLVGHDMEQVIVGLVFLLSSRIYKVCNSVLIVNFDQLSVKVLLNSSLISISFNFSSIFWTGREHCLPDRPVLDFGLVPNAP